MIEIVYCGKSRINNKVAADQAGKNLIAGGKYNLKHFSSLEIMASYLKKENPEALGVIAFCKNEKIMSDGIDVINNFNLFIIKAFRMPLKHIWGMQNIPYFKKYFDKINDFRDYFVVSSRLRCGFQSKFNPADKERWETLLIADNISISDISAVKDVIDCKNFFIFNFKMKNGRVYMKVNCHSFYLKEPLNELKEKFLIKIRIIGTYKLEEMKGE